MDRVAESVVGSGPTGLLSRTLRALAPHAWFLEDEVAGLADVVSTGAVCLDVGAEYGLYTWTLAGLAGPTGHVHAVEPQPGPSAFVDTTRRLLGADTVTVHRTALGAAAGGGVLSLPRRRLLPVHGRAFLTTGATGLGSNSEFSHHEDVPVAVTTLDDLVADLELERLDLVKADIEGAEAHLLRGAHATLATLRPTLMLELEDRHLARFGASVAEIVAELAADGYEARTWHRERGWVPRCLDDERRNVLFTPR
ncbi:FkbM family methyltransferase [Actinomycetospora endophytica]|uniref:FkbM family methyltransferase n=1 Tax=Actinomycetospora endophytica TaxID=2291215 RepID=A0ABS8P532_9PSEU|nr:FkbM family methyltransferase [Actinomycetospora endophytica]MCD2193138.1 FkbM family methyltransferase [Actinomycetospora endophytica]